MGSKPRVPSVWNSWHQPAILLSRPATWQYSDSLVNHWESHGITLDSTTSFEAEISSLQRLIPCWSTYLSAQTSHNQIWPLCMPFRGNHFLIFSLQLHRKIDVGAVGAASVPLSNSFYPFCPRPGWWHWALLQHPAEIQIFGKDFWMMGWRLYGRYF